VGIRDVAEIKERRVVGRERGSEPHVVIHLDIEGRTEWMRER
jgi:hypothetical protein